MSDETPHVVNLPASSELETFLSEFPSEGPGAATHQELLPVGEEAFASEGDAKAEVAPVLKPETAPVRPKADPTESHYRPAVETEPRVPNKPATITEFPVHATRAPAAATSALVPSPITLVDLLEQQGGLEWRRAVAVIHQICGLLKQQPPHQPIVLEPRNILVTHDGQVRLLPALSGGDPLVIQLGRLLRTMLTGNDAPPELRLLLAQATFELPIFESVEDVDRALVQLERLEENAPNSKRFGNSILPPPATDIAPPFQEPAGRSGRSILPKPHASGRRSAKKTSFLAGLYTYGLRVAAVGVIAAALTALITWKPSLLWPSVAPAAATAPPATISGTLAPNPPAAITSPSQPISTPPAAPPAVERDTRARTHIPAPPLVPVPDVRTPRTSPRAPDSGRSVASEPVATVELPSNRATPPRSPAATSGTAVSSRESERRAASLIAQGQTAQAGVVFDALLLSNPLYEPDPTSLTPEALEAFRASQRALLPNIATKNLERARAALAAGDPDRALALGREVAAILERRIAEPAPQLREQVADLIDAASAAKNQADEIVYTAADKGVVAPRELSRQFPASSPLGVPPHRVGTLEMIIDKDGGVEFVKLHTPLNRYHERMIVSAAKAWRYRPATRNGKPVRYRLTVRINLPESGTDF